MNCAFLPLATELNTHTHAVNWGKSLEVGKDSHVSPMWKMNHCKTNGFKCELVSLNRTLCLIKASSSNHWLMLKTADDTEVPSQRSDLPHTLPCGRESSARTYIFFTFIFKRRKIFNKKVLRCNPSQPPPRWITLHEYCKLWYEVKKYLKTC